MSIRQAHPPGSSEGLVGGAIVVIGFVVLIVVAAVDLISSRWSPSSPPSGTTQSKESTSVAPLQKKDDSPSTPDFVKRPIGEPNPLSNVRSTQESVLKNPNPAGQDSQLGYPLIPDLDDDDAAKAEKSKAEVPLDQDQDARQSALLADEIPIAFGNESSQEWISLSKPDESLSPNVQLDSVPTSSSFVHEYPQPEYSSSQQQQETTLEFSSSTLIDAPNKLHESAMTISSETSSSSPTPERDTHSFDNNNNNNNAPVHIQSDAEKQAPLNPQPSVEFSDVLKPRASMPSLYDSPSNRGSTGAGSTSELSTKKKRGGSFIKKSGTLINKVFKNKDTSGTNNDNQPLSSSFVSDLEHSTNSIPGPDADAKKKLTSPSRVSLGSIRSIGGSIKKKIGRSSSIANFDTVKDTIVSGPAVSAQDEESYSLQSNSSHPVKVGSDDAEPSLLKTMFKVRKPSK